MANPLSSPSVSLLYRRKQRAFTLLEALVALIIFTIVTVSLSFAVTTAIHAQQAIKLREEQSGTVRVIFGTLARDIQSAFVSVQNPASVFIANNGQSSGSGAVTTGSLLTLTTLSNRIQMELPDGSTGGSASSSSSTNSQSPTPPQADFGLVRYDLDPSTGNLTRTVSMTPNLETFNQPSSDPSALLAVKVQELTLRFWDTNQQNWRNDWDFEQPNQAEAKQLLQQQQSANSGSSGSSGAAGQNANASTGASSTDASAQSTGDTTLPSAVEVHLVLIRSDGKPIEYRTVIPVLATDPQKNPPNTAPTSTGTSGGTAARNGSRTQ